MSVEERGRTEDQLACFSEAFCHSLDGKISFTSLAALRTWEVVGLVRSEGRGSGEGAAGIEEQTDLTPLLPESLGHLV